ncbi:MAG: hypothetical protein JRI61_12060 [Deltaproteobacteria bacterium]|nr:hypothetical protein [Deltaproteobacteria bacterium]
MNRLFIIFMLVFFACSESAEVSVSKLPDSLAGLALHDSVVGAEADKMIRRMHGKSTGGSSSIGYYGTENRKNVLYLTVFENQGQAEQSLSKMISKMANTRFGFTPPASEKIGNNIIYRSQGMGLSHFFFRRDNLVFWWQAAPDNAEASLAALLAHNFRK